MTVRCVAAVVVLSLQYLYVHADVLKASSPLNHQAMHYVYPGDDPEVVTEAFCKTYAIRLRGCAMLMGKVDEALQAAGEAVVDGSADKPLVSIPVEVLASEYTSRLRLSQFDIPAPSGIALFLSELHGRRVLDDDGHFIFPSYVTRVWIDVGAHHCENTADELLQDPTLAVIAIEANPGAWRVWPLKKQDRLIGIPFIIDEREFSQVFHVTAYDHASSVGEPLTNATGWDVVRKYAVPSIRLERIINAVPGDISIDWVKTDCQGSDLRVLRSAGATLGRRVKLVQAEIILQQAYVTGQLQGAFVDFLEYMKSQGFSFSHLHHFHPDPALRWPGFDIFDPPAAIDQVDAQFLNLALASPQMRAALRPAPAWYYPVDLFQALDDPAVTPAPRPSSISDSGSEKSREPVIRYGFGPKPPPSNTTSSAPRHP